MAAFMRHVRRFNLLLSLRQHRPIERFDIRAKNETCIFHKSGFIVSRYCTHISSRISLTITTKLTVSDLDVVGERLLGENNSNINRLVEDSGCKWEAKVNGDHVHILGYEYAVVKIAKEIVEREIQTIRKAVNVRNRLEKESDEIRTKEERVKWSEVQEKLFIDDNADVCRMVCRHLIHKPGEDMKNLRNGVRIYGKGNHVYITGTRGYAVRRTAKDIAREIRLIVRSIDFHDQGSFKEKVFIDQDVVFQKMIGNILAGIKGREKINQLMIDNGVNIDLYDDYVYITGTDEDAVRRTAEKITCDIQSIRKSNQHRWQFNEKVFLDQDLVVQQEISRMLQEDNGVDTQIHGDYVHIYGTDKDDVRSTAEKITCKILAIRENIQFHNQRQFEAKVLLGQDAPSQGLIWNMLNIGKLIAGSGVKTIQYGDHIYISGTDEDAVRRIAENVRLDIQSIRKRQQHRWQFIEKVFTSEDLFVQYRINQTLIGKRKTRIKKLRVDNGVDIKINDDHVSIFGTDEDAVRRTAETVTGNIQEIRKSMHFPDQESFKEKVFVPQDKFVKNMIMKLLVWKENLNANQLGVFLEIIGSDHYLYIHGTNEDAVRKTAEEVRRITKSIWSQFRTMDSRFEFRQEVFIGEDGENNIKKNIIGKGGWHIKRLQEDNGVNMFIKGDCVYIFGTDEDAVRRTKEHVTYYIQSIRLREQFS